MNKIEILAPGGSAKTIYAAYKAGADAVYTAGQKFGARAYADNLDETQLLELIRYAHQIGRKLYLTVNTLLKNEELEKELYDYILPLYEAGLDAIIVQDYGVMCFLHEHFPDLSIHASTQMTVTGPEFANRLKGYGVTRIVTPRELNLKETKQIADETGLEVESFVHGALCYCYSGQCLMSSLIGGRSGNRGRCAQPCRLPFVLKDQKGNTLNHKNEQYFLSMKDLNSLELLPYILDAGVCSLKIEGRMKRAEYTAGVVAIYRKYVDILQNGIIEGGKYVDIPYHVSKRDLDTLMDLFNRNGFIDGYWQQKNGRSMLTITEREAAREREDLFAMLQASYCTEHVKIPMKLHLTLKIGEPARLRVMAYDGDEQSFPIPLDEEMISNELVQEAAKRPMEYDTVADRMMKLGGTDCALKRENLTIDLDDRIFISVGALNDLRQRACARVLEYNPYRRVARPYQSLQQDTVLSTDCGMALSVRINTVEQLCQLATLFREGIVLHRVYVRDQLLLFSNPAMKSTITQALDTIAKSSELYIELPTIFREQTRKRYDKLNLTDVFRPHFVTGFLVKSAECGAYLMNRLGEAKKDYRLISDATLYSMNIEDVYFLKKQGYDLFTFPYELNRRELNQFGVKGEMIVYGKIPMMVTAQCVKAASGRCQKTEDPAKSCENDIFLVDRKGMQMRVERNCNDCYTTIYNASILNLLAEVNEMKGFANSVRLQFTDESIDVMRMVIVEATRALTGEVPMLPSASYTRGHYKRGVE